MSQAAAVTNGRSQRKQEDQMSMASKKSKASRACDSDGFDSVSQVSVSTPKSLSGRSRAGESVSYVSHQTG
jgi:hypothetical protein